MWAVVENSHLSSRQQAKKEKKQEREQRLKEKDNEERELRKKLGLYTETEETEESPKFIGIYHEGNSNKLAWDQKKTKMIIEVPKTKETAGRLYCSCERGTAYERRKGEGAKRGGQIALEEQFS
eukprot:TRINITY_DN3006_c0_g1_i1.p1 TRINITY_DN3006_c0_g1~~TRINITY_DN3006_c0_g1_i1.p1  ORF type:complete len:124 (-),score=42.95 TRINITY_DN3006_c0_g1_i1:250-621(-)